MDPRLCALCVVLWTCGASGRDVVIDVGTLGAEFDGVGGVSAGTGPRLLVDYEEPMRSDILDFVYLPKFGAGVQVLKIEIGSGVTSSQGSEASHEPEPGVLQPNAGYELWEAKEAKRRNPDIVLYALAWQFPAWVVADTENISHAGAAYITDFVEIAAKSHGLKIDVVGWQNEHVWDISYVLHLRAELDRRGYTNVKIAIGDAGPGPGYQSPDIAQRIAQNASLNAATYAMGFHYPMSILPPTKSEWWGPVEKLSQKRWASEDYSTFTDSNGARCLAKLINRNFIDAGLTRTLVWDLFWSSFDTTPCTGQGLFWAAEPWSGVYGVMDTVWAAAHTTQFTAPGWRYLHGASGGGYLVTPGVRDQYFGSYV
eukprot:Hpha_TRINITY_DN24121_c0_g1::TRINITY_DN24121_c0_g1_i1::g.9830::m.9830/K01202/GALC; galactosylceramidase